MRFIRALVDGQTRVGVLRDDDTVAVSPSDGDLESHFGDDGALLQEAGSRILADPATVTPLAELELLAPVRPTSLRDFMVFEQHVMPMWNREGLERGPEVWYERPIGYFSNAASIRGPREAIEVPGDSERLDFELEMAAVIGKDARSVTPEMAAAHIAGYVILCDWSARDMQMREMEGRLGPFKGKDFASSLGSIFVTPDHIEDRRSRSGYDLTMESSVNGRHYGGDSWSSATWSLEELLSYASWNSIVEAGALIGTGTCQGGCISELSTRHSPSEFPWLQPGDEVTLTVQMHGDIRAEILPPQRGEWPGFRHAVAPARGGA